MQFPSKTLAALLLITGAQALAEPVCGYWQYVNDSTEIRVCVDDNGRQYCERRYNKDNSTIQTVSCA